MVDEKVKDDKCQSGFMTLPPEPLSEQPAVVLLLGRPLAFWLLALGERGSGCLSIIPFIHGRTKLYCAQACLA
jgi:hypothetical protein